MKKRFVVLLLIVFIPSLTFAGGSYDKEQQIHCLAFLSNQLSGCRFENVKAMEACADRLISGALADPTIQSFIGNDWTVVWGPVAYTNNPNADSVIADNTMGVFYSPSQKLFVVSIAGTNPISVYGWIQEDLSVNNMVYWKTIINKPLPLLAAISMGTNRGLQILLRMKDSKTSGLMLDALKDYISTNNISGAEVAVAGHSLGGALSPTLALYMLDRRDLWDPTNTATLSTYPSAGPTPGGGYFADYYESKIKNKKITYVSKYNTLDAVPMAWNGDTLCNIPELYKDQIKPVKGADPDLPEPTVGMVTIGLYLDAMATKFFTIPVADPYRQIQPWTPLQGTFNKSLDKSIKSKIGLLGWVLPKKLKPYIPYLSNIARFAAQAAYQHTSQYSVLFNVTGFSDRLKGLHKPCCKTDGSDAHTAAVKDAIGIDLNTLEAKVKAIKREKKEKKRKK